MSANSTWVERFRLRTANVFGVSTGREEGQFWLVGSPHRACPGTLEAENEKWLLSVDGQLFEPEGGLAVQRSGNTVVRTLRGDPASEARDFAPRVVFGRLNDGTPVSLLDAQLMDHSPLDFEHFARQQFSGWRALRGAHAAGVQDQAQGVRWSLDIPLSPGGQGGNIKTDEGVLSDWAHDGRRGISLVLDEPRGVGDLAGFTARRITSVFAVACGIELEPLHREVLIANQWCAYGVDRVPEQAHHLSDFIPLHQVNLEFVARWADHSTNLGALPFRVPISRSVLQADAHTLASALEGLHRHLHPDEDPFPCVSKKGRKRAVNAAVDAGVQQLTHEGWTDREFAHDRFRSALAQVGQMSYRERLRVLLNTVTTPAPGLLGPDAERWITAMVEVRNNLSHVLPDEGGFGDKEISEYYVLTESAKWALRIAMLSPLVSDSALHAALQRSTKFSYSLANIDNEGYWEDYSCLRAFQDAASPVDEGPPDAAAQ